MSKQKRLIFVVIFTAIVMALCGAGLRAQDDNHAQSRSKERQQTKEKRRKESPPAKTEKSQERRSNPQDQARERADRNTPESRHPRPDGRYDRYSWREYDSRRGRDRERFPRAYRGYESFRWPRYNRARLSPHGLFWYHRDNLRFWFYWPYFFAPERGCGWYAVPRHRRGVFDSNLHETYWEYTSWEYVYICFD